jgi:H+/Cl- antiporter ClcA
MVARPIPWSAFSRSTAVAHPAITVSAVSEQDPREHLDHLPGRIFLGIVAGAAAAATIVAGIRLFDSGDKLLWSVAVGLGALALVAVGVAWEERRAHVHALVREALEESPADIDPVAELMRMGAHREAEYVASRRDHPNRSEET